MTARCSSCRWWERSNNFRAIGRDWGLCHFWGGNIGFRIGQAFIDRTVGHEPRGSDTCAWHNAEPDERLHIHQVGAMPAGKPAFKSEGE